MEQMRQNEAGALTAQAIPQKDVEQACFHALGLIGRNCEYLDQHLAHVGADQQTRQAVNDISAASARLDRTVNEVMSLLDFLRTEEDPRLYPLDLCQLLQQLAQVQRIEPRVFLGAQKIQQRHHFVHSAVQPCRRSADIVHRLPGLLVGTHMRKVLVQIFAIASDQAQCMEACLFHILLRDRLRGQCTRLVLPHLLHTLAPPVFYAQSSF